MNKRILFIGNSLTYENDLPGMVQRTARSAGASIGARRRTARVRPACRERRLGSPSGSRTDNSKRR
ncbi:hypothetical protein [Cohnella hongkongensis]|uniref:Uncharacterized protein n=1 Tax=Cohnella hongkongensis TaxID=178337 RepID=A0ABV9FJ92_9BACL